jgi:hypothetical protein
MTAPITGAPTLAEEFVASRSKTVVETKKGNLVGALDDGVYSYLGVPYAHADRFMPAEEVAPWKGIRPAVTYGENCFIPQMKEVAEAVRRTPRCRRSKSALPSSASSSRICRLTAACEMNSSCAAGVKLSRQPATSNVRKAVNGKVRASSITSSHSRSTISSFEREGARGGK